MEIPARGQIVIGYQTYELIGTLGHGSTCKVKLGQNKEDDKYYAIKMMKDVVHEFYKKQQ